MTTPITESSHTEHAPGVTNRRRFIAGAGLTVLGLGSLSAAPSAFGAGDLSTGDAAILRFLSAAEILETDLWQQYNELCGIQDHEVPHGTGNKAFTEAVSVLDADMAQYVHDNTEDEFTHFTFINAYLQSRGAQPVNLDMFRTLPGSTARGAANLKRITNLMELTVDTSWWTRYRARNKNPDNGDSFAQAVPALAKGRWPAIPRNNADLKNKKHLQAIANTAGFHFGTIEQGGTSLYPALAQRVQDPDVLRVVLSIGPTEAMHFQTWQDKAGNATPLTVFDKGNNSSVTFSNLQEAQGETNPESLNGDTLQANLIMPEPTHFLNPKFGPVAIVRPTSTKLGGATAAVMSFVNDGLFRGQKPLNNPELVRVLLELAEDADNARRQF